MELPLETVALFALKLAYEREGESPILRDDPIMSDYEREVFGLLVRRGDVEGIQFRVAHRGRRVRSPRRHVAVEEVLPTDHERVRLAGELGGVERCGEELEVRRGDLESIQFRVAHCVGLALDAIGGADTPLGRELHRLSADFSNARTMAQLDAPLTVLKNYLKDIQ